MKKNNTLRGFFIVVVCILSNAEGYAQVQVNKFKAGYFHNQYLFNPAMAGREAREGNVSAGYAKQGNIANAPRSYYLSGEYGFNENMGAGINILHDKAGIQNSTRLMGSYSYHLKLGAEKQQLHFGISAGAVLNKIDNYTITGDLNDPALYNYNDQSADFEADAGLAYTDGKLNIQASVPGIVAAFDTKNKNIANRPTFFAAASYKVEGDKNAAGISFEPKVVYRGFKTADGIVDAGINVGFLKDVLNVFGLYHSSKNFTAGASFLLLEKAQIMFAYSTQAKEFKSYSNGDLEFGLRFSIK